MSQNLFPPLRAIVAKEKLYESNVWIPVRQLIQSALCFSACIALASISTGMLPVIILATLAGFFSLQLGYVMHDAGHRQCSRKTIVNDILGYLSTAIIGLSFVKWMDVHNEHHDNPNHEDDDPDISLPFVAYSEKQVHDNKSELHRWLITRQVWFYPVLLLFIMYSKRAAGLFDLILHKKKTPGVLLDIALVSMWHIWFPVLLYLALGLWPAVLFFAVLQASAGFFFGMVFAPNHKGMPIIERGTDLDFFTRQVMTARNFRSNSFIDFLYGGLNYQIEHHLFPNMPRYHLSKAKKLTEKYCKEQGVSYHETSLIGSYIEIYHCLNDVAEHAKIYGKSEEDLYAHVLDVIASLKQDLASQILDDMKSQAAKDWSEAKQWISQRLQEIELSMREKSQLRKQMTGEYLHEVTELGIEAKHRMKLLAAA